MSLAGSNDNIKYLRNPRPFPLPPSSFINIATVLFLVQLYLSSLSLVFGNFTSVLSSVAPLCAAYVNLALDCRAYSGQSRQLVQYPLYSRPEDCKLCSKFWMLNRRSKCRRYCRDLNDGGTEGSWQKS